ncbi:MAG: hypothetical protein Q8K26_05200 [Candidatus Gracilibacteria bacterium]|nr:hypothetical protein [Candidatus Gracilibacteria bacterium]
MTLMLNGFSSNGVTITSLNNFEQPLNDIPLTYNLFKEDKKMGEVTIKLKNNELIITQVMPEEGIEEMNFKKELEVLLNAFKKINSIGDIIFL